MGEYSEKSSGLVEPWKKEKSKSLKDYLLTKYPPKGGDMETNFNARIWNECTFEVAQEISNRIIEMFKEKDMTYTDAYAMLGYVREDLDYRSERIKL